MGRLIRWLSRAARWPFRAVARRPGPALFVVCLFVSGSAGGLYGYGVHQWRRARINLAEDRLEEARARLAWCLLVWPNHPDVHFLAARAARLSGDLAAAEAHLNRCRELQNGATEAVQLEFLLMRAQSGEIDEVALPLIRLVEDRHPESLLILETLARYYMHRLRYKEAYACLSRWIEDAPDAAKPYHWRAWVLERLNNHKRAMEDYQRALQLNPDLSRVRLRVAEMHLEEKQPLEAIPHLERLIRELPESPEVQSRLGVCRFIQGRGDEARRLLAAALPHLPNDPLTLLYLARLDLLDGRAVEAEQWVRRVLAADATDSEAYFVLASILQHQGRTEEAAAALREHERARALIDRLHGLLRTEAERPTTLPDVPTEIGTILLGIGRDQLAKYWLDQALARNPMYEPAHKALAEYYERKGDRETAQLHRRQVRDPGAQKAP